MWEQLYIPTFTSRSSTTPTQGQYSQFTHPQIYTSTANSMMNWPNARPTHMVPKKKWTKAPQPHRSTMPASTKCQTGSKKVFKGSGNVPIHPMQWDTSWMYLTSHCQQFTQALNAPTMCSQLHVDIRLCAENPSAEIIFTGSTPLLHKHWYLSASYFNNCNKTPIPNGNPNVTYDWYGIPHCIMEADKK